MSIIRITKIFYFEMAHALPRHDGPCKNIHGHSYSLEVTISGIPVNDTANPKNGMVMDFADLKKIVTEHITGKLDHALMLNEETLSAEEKKFLFEKQKLVLVNYDPTCENMLLDFSKTIRKYLPQNIKLQQLKLRETPASYAEWIAGDNP